VKLAAEPLAPKAPCALPGPFRARLDALDARSELGVELADKRARRLVRARGARLRALRRDLAELRLARAARPGALPAALTVLEYACNGKSERFVFGGEGYRCASVDACLSEAWTLGLFNRTTGEELLVPFRCRSWRCARCAPAVNARDAQRVVEGLGKQRADDLVFITLTFDPAPFLAIVREELERRGQNPGPREVERRAKALAWSVTARCWKRLRDRLGYRLGEGKGRARKRAKLANVQTWESHRSGWPHVHAVISSAELARDVRAEGSYLALDPRTGTEREYWRWVTSVLKPLCVAVGLGEVADLQFPRSWRAVGGYLAKLAAELTHSNVKGQTPTAAPRHFRRIRSTPLLIPRSRVEGFDWSGCLLCATPDALLSMLDSGHQTWKAAEACLLELAEKLPFSARLEPPNVDARGNRSHCPG
jgi:hypothetical protein